MLFGFGSVGFRTWWLKREERVEGDGVMTDERGEECEGLYWINEARVWSLILSELL